MGPSVSFPLPLRIAQKLPIRNSWELIIKKLPIPLPAFYYFKLIREVLANTGYVWKQVLLKSLILLHSSNWTKGCVPINKNKQQPSNKTENESKLGLKGIC